MLAIVNSHIPPQALRQLSRHAEVIPFHSEGVTPPALSGHADLFISVTPDALVTAPNLPTPILQTLSQGPLPLCVGQTPIGHDTATLGAYNVAVGQHIVLANPRQIDPVVAAHLGGRRLMATRQGLCRCGALCLGDAVLTSDGGIAKVCRREGLEHLLVDATPIQLPGYRSGCLGGCCGVTESSLYLLGSLRHHPQGVLIEQFAHRHGRTVIELYDGPLYDAGSILIVE